MRGECRSARLPRSSRVELSVSWACGATPLRRDGCERVKGKRNGEILRIKYVDLEGRRRMTTLKVDLKYWPTFLLTRGPNGDWVRKEVV